MVVRDFRTTAILGKKFGVGGRGEVAGNDSVRWAARRCVFTPRRHALFYGPALRRHAAPTSLVKRSLALLAVIPAREPESSLAPRVSAPRGHDRCRGMLAGVGFLAENQVSAWLRRTTTSSMDRPEHLAMSSSDSLPLAMSRLAISRERSSIFALTSSANSSKKLLLKTL